MSKYKDIENDWLLRKSYFKSSQTDVTIHCTHTRESRTNIINIQKFALKPKFYVCIIILNIWFNCSENWSNFRVYHAISTVTMNVHDFVSKSILCTYIYDFLCTISKVCFRCYGNASVYGRRLCALWSLSFHYLGHEYYVS